MDCVLGVRVEERWAEEDMSIMFGSETAESFESVRLIAGRDDPATLVVCDFGPDVLRDGGL